MTLYSWKVPPDEEALKLPASAPECVSRQFVPARVVKDKGDLLATDRYQAKSVMTAKTLNGLVDLLSSQVRRAQ